MTDAPRKRKRAAQGPADPVVARSHAGVPIHASNPSARIPGVGTFYPPVANSGGDRVRGADYGRAATAAPVGVAAPTTPATAPERGDIVLVRSSHGTYWIGPCVVAFIHPHSGGLVLHRPDKDDSFVCIANDYGASRGQWQYADDVPDAEYLAERAHEEREAHLQRTEVEDDGA